MAMNKPVLRITMEQWHAKKTRGLAAVIDERAYIVMMDEGSREMVYQAVVIVRGG
jgi:hypothetical protein